MEEKKKVYVRGRKGRGSEIHGILTGLGATDAHGIRCENEDAIYFINHKNKISCADTISEVALIIMDNYKEIELPQRQQPWKDGDILVNDRYTHCYAVFKKYKDNDTFETYFFLDGKTALFNNTAYVGGYHLASEEEIKNLPPLFCLLMCALNKVGLCLPKNVAQNPLPDNKINRLEEGDD